MTHRAWIGDISADEWNSLDYAQRIELHRYQVIKCRKWVSRMATEMQSEYLAPTYEHLILCAGNPAPRNIRRIIKFGEAKFPMLEWGFLDGRNS
jgi:hypothetical protein